MKSDMEEMWGWKAGSWVWCMHCQRYYKVGEYREVVEGRGAYRQVLQLCPYEDCDGSPLDASLAREGFEPVRGRIYDPYHPETL